MLNVGKTTGAAYFPDSGLGVLICNIWHWEFVWGCLRGPVLNIWHWDFIRGCLRGPVLNIWHWEFVWRYLAL